MEDSQKHNLDLEQALAACLVLDGSQVAIVGGILSPRDLYHQPTRNIITAVFDLFNTGQKIDIVTVVNWLNKKRIEEPTRDGWAIYITELTSKYLSLSSLHVEDYAREIHRMSVLRGAEMLMLSSRMDLNKADTNVFEVLGKHQRSIIELVSSMEKVKAEPISQLIMRVMSDVDDQRAGKETTLGYATSIHKLDEHTAGVQVSALTMLAARPSMGKTALMNGIAMHVAQQHHVEVFSAEMSKNQETIRMLSTAAQIEYMRIALAKKMHPHEVARLSQEGARLSRLNLHVDDTPSPTILDLRSKIARAVIERDVKLVCIDHLGLVRLSNKRSRYEELGEVAGEIKAIGKEHGISILLLHQLNRGVESRDDKRPMLSDLRDSGNLEEHADVVLFIYRPEYYGIEHMPDDETVSSVGKAHIIVAKNRNGAVGGFDVGFQKEYTRFYNLTGAEAHGVPPIAAASSTFQHGLPVGDIDGPTSPERSAGRGDETDPLFG